MKRTPLASMSPKRRKALTARAVLVKVVRERDSDRCQFWNAINTHPSETLAAFPMGCTYHDGRPDVHEIIPRSAWPAGWLVIENTICLCRAHHQWVDRFPADAHTIGLHSFSWNRPQLVDAEDEL